MTPWPFRRVPPPGLGSAGSGEEDVREEIELYLELRARELEEEGWEPDEARREAERRFGDPDTWVRRARREQTMDHGGGGWKMEQVARHLRYAARTLRRAPGFTVVAVLTLALALAGNTAIFSVLDAAVLRALPFPDSDRLVFVNGVHRPPDGTVGVRMASIPEFMDWRERSSTLTPMVGVDVNMLTLTGQDGGAERIAGEMVSEGYFELLDVEAALGRTFTPEEYRTPDAHPLVVISHGLWQRRFGGDPAVLGRSLVVNDRTATVLGVMPADFQPVNDGTDLWFTFGMVTFVGPVEALDDRGSRFLPVVARLAPGAGVEDAQREMDRIAADLEASFPDLNEDRGAQVVSFREGFLGSTGRLLWILFGAGTLLLLIAAANVANLLLVRANARSREQAVRRSLGAQRGRIVAQLLTESVLLSTMGAVAGLLLAGWMLQALPAFLPDGTLPAFVEPGLSARAFVFTFVVLTAVGVTSGLAPALLGSGGDLASDLRQGGRGSAGGRTRLQKLFVVTQIALALFLLVGAGLLARSLRAQLAVDPGLDVDGLHVFRVQAPREGYPDAEALRRFTEDVRRAVAGVAGVEAVAVGSDFPFRGRSSGSFIARTDDVESPIRYHRHSVTPGYFELLGTELVAGRLLDDEDGADGPGVAVVTEAMVERVFPEDPRPIGRGIWVGNPANPENLAEIVGIVRDLRYRDLTTSMLEGPNSPDVFFSIRQVPSRTLEVAYRTASGALQLAAVRAAMAEVDPTVPVYFPQTVVEAYEAQTAMPRFAAFLMGLFSALALLLAAVGLYGVLAFTVGQRGPEIALRRALGARAGDVARSVVLDGVRLSALGLLIGAAAAWAGATVLERFLFGVDARDPATLLAVVAAMLVVAALSASVPAWRAAQRAPAEVLAGE